jgi:hypothetical protein
MNCYYYATVKGSAFLEMFKVPRLPDSYIAADSESGQVDTLLQAGFRFVSLHEPSDLALLEKVRDEIPPVVREVLGGRASRDELIKVVRALLDDYENEHGEGVCDCRHEPENQGHVCNACAARIILRQES